MKHTPGPWHDDGYRIYAPTCNADKRNSRVIVEYKHVDNFNYADGPLLAAAPELLQAVKELKAIVRGWSDSSFNGLMPQIEALIKKAEGGE